MKFFDSLEAIMVQVYYCVIYSIITYGILVWVKAYCRNCKPVMALQKRVARVNTFRDHDCHSEPLFARLKLLNCIRFFLLMYPKCIDKRNYNLLPKALEVLPGEHLLQSMHTYKTRLASKQCLLNI